MIGGQKTAAAALLIAVFLAGILGGAAGTKMMDRRVGRHGGDQPDRFDRLGSTRPWMRGTEEGADRRGLMPMWFTDRLARELDLTEEQREGIKDILDSRRQQADELMEQIGPRLKAELDSMQLEIRALLSPEQQLLFDQFQEREGERMFRRMSNPMRGPPPGGLH